MLDLLISYSKCRLSRCAVLGTVLMLLSFLWQKLILVIVMAVTFAFYLMHSLHTNKFMSSVYLHVLRCIVRSRCYAMCRGVCVSRCCWDAG